MKIDVVSLVIIAVLTFVVEIAALTFIIEMGLLYLFVAGLSYLVCLGFHFHWSWALALGVWAACVLILWLVRCIKDVIYDRINRKE